MRLCKVLATCSVALMGFGAQNGAAQNPTAEAWKLEARGDAAEAHEQLQKAAESAPNNPLALQAYAEFLGHHRDPAAAAAYENWWRLRSRSGASASERAKAARRMVELDLLAGDRTSAQNHLEAFLSAGGSGLSLPAVAVP